MHCCTDSLDGVLPYLAYEACTWLQDEASGPGECSFHTNNLGCLSGLGFVKSQGKQLLCSYIWYVQPLDHLCSPLTDLRRQTDGRSV